MNITERKPNIYKVRKPRTKKTHHKHEGMDGMDNADKPMAKSVQHAPDSYVAPSDTHLLDNIAITDANPGLNYTDFFFHNPQAQINKFLKPQDAGIPQKLDRNQYFHSTQRT